MNRDISRRVDIGGPPLSSQLARRLRREEDELAARTRLINEIDIAQALVAEAAVHRHRHVARAVRAALEEDPLNIGTVELLEAYANGAAQRIRRFDQ